MHKLAAVVAVLVGALLMWGCAHKVEWADKTYWSCTSDAECAPGHHCECLGVGQQIIGPDGHSDSCGQQVCIGSEKPPAPP